jgi:vitamin B12/bleomycin/antimicrobial peptide transport system ATP-binding/permease protein
MLALLLITTIVAVRITVLISYYTNDVFTSLQVALQGIATGRSEVTDSGIHGFWVTIGIFLILAVVHVVLNLVDMYVMQRFIMRWRIWLSARVMDDWLGDFAYYRRQFLRRPNDNPDQRIQQDIDIFTTGVGGQTNNPAYGSGNTLLFGAVAAVLSVIAFGAILWQLSGTLTLGGFTLPRALFWIVIVYVLAATVVAFVIGRPLIQLSYLNELRNAGFRYALVRVRDASAAIGLYRGENVERRLLTGRLSEVMANYGNWLIRMVRFTGWNLTVSQAINPLPYVVQAPRLFAREISFGDVIQSATAFVTIHNALSFFREV